MTDAPERTPLSEDIQLKLNQSANSHWIDLRRNTVWRWKEKVAALEQGCTCEWTHPVDGNIDANWPAELDPYCKVHGEPNGFPESKVAALEQELDMKHDLWGQACRDWKAVCKVSAGHEAEVERLRAEIGKQDCEWVDGRHDDCWRCRALTTKGDE